MFRMECVDVGVRAGSTCLINVIDKTDADTVNICYVIRFFLRSLSDAGVWDFLILLVKIFQFLYEIIQLPNLVRADFFALI